MEKLIRFSTTVPPALLERYDRIIREKGYANRSEAVRDLIRDYIVSQEWESSSGEVVGTLTLVYDHHVRGVSDRLTDAQHSHTANILSTMHVHLDHHNCVEVLVLKGTPEEVRRIADTLISARGVKHGKLVSTSTGENIE